MNTWCLSPFWIFSFQSIHTLCSAIQSMCIIHMIYLIFSFKICIHRFGYLHPKHSCSLFHILIQDMHTSFWTPSSKTFMLSFPLLYSWHACLCSDVIIQNTYDLFSIHLVQNKHIVLSILSDSSIFQGSFFKLREFKTLEKFILHSDLTNCTMSRRGVNS